MFPKPYIPKVQKRVVIEVIKEAYYAIFVIILNSLNPQQFEQYRIFVY